MDDFEQTNLAMLPWLDATLLLLAGIAGSN
jgi:hypothetical protein